MSIPSSRDDVATIAKLAAASLDDVGAAAGKAGSKAVGVVVDDAAVTPRYVTGLTPDRELPIIARIAVGSLRNKLLILLPVALLLSSFAPWAVTPLLMLGGAFLCFEGAEKVIEAFGGGHHEAEQEALAPDAATLEQRIRAGGAGIRPDARHGAAAPRHAARGRAGTGAKAGRRAPDPAACRQRGI